MKSEANILLLLCVLCYILESTKICGAPEPQRNRTDPSVPPTGGIDHTESATPANTETIEATTVWVRNATLRGCTHAGGTMIRSSVKYAFGMCFIVFIVVPFLA